ncbi:MAG: DUF6498-containing protein [Opitutales bacterium]
MNADPANVAPNCWVQAWPDALAFAGGLTVAWFAHWQTTDLVWSLWLSSLVVGYASILWMASATLREFVRNARASLEPGGIAGKMLMGGALVIGTLFTAVFFTVHFGGFHLVHSVFLNVFFPIYPAVGRTRWPGVATYLEVARRYWIFLPMAFLAERAIFVAKPTPPDDGAVTAAAIARRKAAAAADNSMMKPYKNVMRMHFLIFFFAGASFAKLDNFLVYAVVYAVYFFPWRLLKAA